MTVLPPLAALAVSISALGYLAATDAKRRRVFGQEPVERGPWQSRGALAALFLPGLLLLVAGMASGFTIWIAAVTVGGWIIAGVRPDTSAGFFRSAKQAARATVAGEGLHLAWHLTDLSGRIAELETRVAELESELARLRRPAIAAPKPKAAAEAKAKSVVRRRSQEPAQAAE